MRPKTQQRLSILAVIVVLGLAAASALYLHLRSLRNADIAARRQQGIDAFARGDYDQAHSLLHWYAYRVQRDPEAYYDLAVSCTKLSDIDGSLVPEAIQSFRRYIDMVNPATADDKQKAQYDDAQHKLMTLFIRESGGESEAIRLADVILKGHPGDLDALNTLAWVNERDPKHYDAALASSLEYNQLKPTDLDLQALTLHLMAQLNNPPEKLIAHADALKKAYPDDPRFDLVEVMAHFEAAEIPDAPVDQRTANVIAGKMALAATTQPGPPDAQFVNRLVFFLDGLNQFSQSLATLQRAADKLNDPQIEQAYVQRLWQDQKYTAVVDRTKAIDPATADAQVVALRVLSLDQLNQHQSAQELVDALDKRSSTQPVAHAWTVALRARLASATQSPRVTLEQYKRAQEFDQRNTIIRYLVGETYFELGEQDLALQQWKLATSQDPSWALPHMRIAEIEQDKGQSNDDAIAQAQRALWAEQTLPTVITGLYAEYNRVRTSGDIDQIRKVLADVKALQDRIPNEPQTLPIYISLLCQTHDAADRDKAVTLLDSALHAASAAGQDTLLRLAQVSLAQQLGRENDLLDAAQKNYGLTPALAMARAGVMIAANHSSAEVIDQVRKDADTALAATQPSGVPAATRPVRAPTRADWDLVIAQILELTHSPDAAAAWTTLGDANPDNLVIQDAILQSATAWTNRPFMERTVQRVHDLTTDESLNWQIGRARYLLTGPGKKEDSAEAIHILSHVIDVAPGQLEPRLLMATALEAAGNPQGAIDELIKANTLNQNMPEVLYPLVRLEHAAGNADDARKYAVNLAGIPRVSSDLLRAAASMLADQGDYALSQSLLDKAGGEASDPSRQALLAYLDWHQGKINDASTIYFQLLDLGVRDAAIIQQIADFFASQRDIDHARKCLAQLDSLNLPPGQKEQIVAAFDDQQIDDAAAAAAAYAAAIKAAPDDPAIWAADIGFQIRHGQLDAARKLLDSALAANPAQGQLTALRDLCRKMTGLAMSPDNLALVSALTKDPTDPAAGDTLDAIIDAAARNQAPQQLTMRLSALADKYPRFLPVYFLTVQRLLHADRADQALALAQRAKDLLPNSAPAAKMLTNVYGFMGRWSDMSLAAQVWRQRSLDNTLEPDVALAVSDLATGKGADALSLLQPYLKSGAADASNAELTTTYARALIAVAREDDAAAFLSPLAQKSADWRAKWLSLALVTHSDAAGAMAWVRRVVPMIPTDSVAEQCLLANTWYNIGVRYSNTDAYTQAQAVLSPLSGRNDLPPDTLMTLASAMDQAGDKKGAEQMYRRVLQGNPHMAPAQNNLAYLLLMKNDPSALGEAENLAKSAVAAAPKDPQTGPYYDTLARVYVKESQTAAAEAAFAQATTLQPWNVDALIGLGDARISLNQVDKAGEALAQIDALVRNGTIALSADQQRQVENLRDACKSIVRNPVTGTN